jgi:hypothetical protein
VNATAVAAIATKYRNDWEGCADIRLISSLYPEEIRDKGQLPALRFLQIAMSSILSDALIDDHCKGLLRLIVGLIDGVGLPKATRILRLANVKRK